MNPSSRRLASISISAACSRMRHGIAVLTKSDLVDRETLDVVRLEVEEFLRNSFLDPAQSSVIAVSSLTGAGLDELKQALVKAAAEIPARDSSAFGASPHRPRVHHERIWRGGDRNADFRHDPQRRRVGGFSGRPARAGSRNSGAWADREQAVAGQRTALNLAGVDHTGVGARHGASTALDLSPCISPGCFAHPAALRETLERSRPRASARLHV